MGTHVVLYSRISQDRDGEAVGVERQEAACRQYIEEHGLTLVGTYCDNNRSAMKGKRPEFQRMLADLDGVDAIVVWSADRLYRRLAELEHLVDVLGRTRIIALHSGDVDLSTADGRSIARILGSIGQRESEKTGERVAAAARSRALAGQPHGGPRGFGWNADGTPRAGEIEAVVDAVAAMDRGASLASVVRDWQGRGLSSARGGGVSALTVKRAVRNPRLVGMRRYRGRLLPAGGPALVDLAMWQRVNAKYAPTGRGARPTTLLSGIARCGVCGGWMRAQTRSRNGVTEAAYRCFDNRCTSRKRESLDALAVELLAAYIRSNRPAIEARMASAGAAGDDGEAEALRERLGALSALAADGSLDPRDYAAAAGPLRARLDALEQMAARRSAMPATGAVLASGGDVASLPTDRLRAVLSELVEAIDVPKGRGAPAVVWRA